MYIIYNSTLQKISQWTNLAKTRRRLSTDNLRYLPIKSVHVSQARMRNVYGNMQRYTVLLHVLAAAHCRNLLTFRHPNFTFKF
jgi:hypothetical protein